ncbi:MAG: insulinase family protein [Candidatus Cloacimonetes bacterium]|nr:insulinase family protein [Candidatus Cloacimonadota bacterium]
MKIKIFASLLLSALLAVLLAQPAELLQMPLQQDPAVLAGQFDNGLSYYIMRNPKPANLAEMRLYVDIGSVNEDEDQRGLAHFTEHMAFNGTANFAKAEVAEYLSSIGMGYYNGLNAMTSYDYTAYTLKIPTDDEVKLKQGLLILSDMAHQLSFEATEIERERGVIIEEWRLGQDAASRVRDAQNAVFLAGSRYAERSPIGTYEVISGFEHDTIKRFYRDWYRPDLQSVVIVGDFEPPAMLALVEQYFGAIPARENPRPREDFSVPENLEPQAIVTTDPEYPNNVLQVMWKKDVQRVTNIGGFYDNLATTLFYTMLNHRLEEHSKRPDPPYSFAVATEYPLLRTMSAAAMFAMYTQGKSEEALSTILTEAERVQRFGFLPSEFERAKIDVLRGAEREVAEQGTRESGEIAWGIVDALSNGNVYTSAELRQMLIQELIELVSLEEVNALVADLIQDKNMFIGLAGPQKEGLIYPAESSLLEIARTVNTLEIEPYEDVTVDEPIMEMVPPPAAIVGEEIETGTLVRIWTLANGVKVYAKATDFKNDEMLLRAVSPGGSFRYPAEELPASQLLSGFVEESGFGNFDSISLRKATAGKVANASLSVGAYSESVNASCSPQDMELMFQLLYQYATNPRFDAQEYDSHIQRMKTYYQNRNLEPMNVFMNRMYKELFAYHPYQTDLADADLDAVDLADLEAVFTDRFADFSDFSFIIVGAFDWEQLKHYCQTYLGNLPALKRDDTPADPGLLPFSGIREARFHKGSSDRAFVANFTSGDYEFSLQNEVDLKALEFVLNEKLRENIREELSGVYFIQAFSLASDYPRSYSALGTFMGCSPARVDELNAAIFATLDSLKAGQLEEKYVTAARETMKQQYQEDIRSNSYWLNQLQSSVWLKRPLGQWLNIPACHDALSRERILAAASKYLNFAENKLSVIMLPENGLN